ncbi:MAG: cation transporter [Clostridia bacterium]|nr:cation transporter [Clostridia bacterium]MBQ2111444.1 cation transporter [Clostridia bacterium]MBQ2191646.1 cation transporter [Clostridia bacterium]MBQ3938257.1 cation transporter [Clostridia bacterium]MBQ5487935.1 cation transporter [Clostridia bacterium]
MKKTYKITGVDCANCAAKMEQQISKIDGVNSCSLSFVLQKLTLDCEPEKLSDVLGAASSIVKKIDRGAKILY